MTAPLPPSSSAAVLSSVTVTKPRGGRRKPPSPNSVLDPAALRQALDDANVSVKPAHIDAFYHALHRQGYPSLADFCKTYEFYDQNVGNLQVLPSIQQIPLRNKITLRKNRNKTHLPRAFLNFLQTTTQLTTLTSKVLKQQTSRDGSTTKLAIELHDGHVVESVLMRYVNPTGGRASLCISSQVGCSMACTFCATGTMGLFGNLVTGEILEQVVHADHILAAEQVTNGDNDDDDVENESAPPKRRNGHAFVRNVVFMGMGEPLDNFTSVTAACRALIHHKRWNLAHHCVTVSTVGIVSQMRKLTAELPEVGLALSLHAPNQAAREAIVPTASRYPIEQLIDALDNHMTAFKYRRRSDGSIVDVNAPPKETLRRRAMIEYVMLEGTTSTLKCAHELGQLCQGKSLVVNLIPYNSTNVKDKLQCPSESHMQEFRRIVASYKVFCTIRRTMGADIDSACGQLVQAVIEDREQQGESAVVDIEDVVGSSQGCAIAVSTMASKRSLSKSTASSDTRDIVAIDSKRSPCTSIDLEAWIVPLSVVTAVSACAFLISLAHFVKPRRQ